MSSMCIMTLSPRDLSVATTGLVVLVKTQDADDRPKVQYPGVVRNDPPVGCKQAQSACYQVLSLGNSLSHVSHTHV